MFKMGCSMARKILAPSQTDSADSTSGGGLMRGDVASSTTAAHAPLSTKSSKSKAADKSHNVATSNQTHQTGGSDNSGAPRARPGGPTSELDDFTKLNDDPRIPLNVRQIFKITKSWKAIARAMSKTGTAMFLVLFEQNKDLFYLFDRFQHLKGTDLHNSMELREHAATVMSTLDHSINLLGDYDNFVIYLHSIGKLHTKVPGFRRDHFWKIEQPFMKAVKQTLDERCNETIEEIYKIAIKLIIETIAEGYGEDQQSSADQQQGQTSSCAEDKDKQTQESRTQTGGGCPALKGGAPSQTTGGLDKCPIASQTSERQRH